MGDGGTAWIGGRRRMLAVLAGVLVLVLLIFGVVRALTAGAGSTPKAVATVVVDRGAVTTEVATTGTLQPAQTRSLSFPVTSTVQSIAVRPGSEVTPGQQLATVDHTAAATAVDTARDSLTQAEQALTDAKTSAAAAAAAAPATPARGCTGTDVPAGYWTPGPSAPPTAVPTSHPSPSPTRTVPPKPTLPAPPQPTRPAPTQPTRPQPTRTAPTQPTRTGPPRATTAAPRGGPAAPKATCSTGGQSGTRGGSSGGGQGSVGGDAVLSAQQRVTQANVTLQNAEDALDGTSMTAPIAGRILAVAGKVGAQVGGGSTFITLADVYDMQIGAAFPEADADRLAVRQKAAVTLADRPGKVFAATVVQVDPTGTSDGTMVRYGVVLSFTDAPRDLLVGQSAAVRVTTGSAGAVPRVPSTALHDVTGDTATVLRSAGGVTSSERVGIGLRGDQFTQITSGLAEGETVVRSW